MTVFLFIVILALLVFSHELGPFSVAKFFGIRVDEFGLGFPPRLWARKRGETEYSLNLLPIGGFVKIFGETPDDESLRGPDRARSLVAKPRLVQAAVLVAGVAANFLLAWLLLSLGYLFGLPTPVSEIGLTDRQSATKLLIVSLSPDSPAAGAGLKAGDELVALARADKPGAPQPVLTPEQVQSFVARTGERPLVVHYRRGAVFKQTDLPTQTVTLTPVAGLVADRPAIGIAMDQIAISRKNLPAAIGSGLVLAGRLSLATVRSLGQLFAELGAGKNVLNYVTGPVGLVGLVGDASSLGWIYLLSFTAFISINLMIINLIPFPALDGGRLLFLLIEKIKGSMISPKIANAVNLAGFVLLIALMLLVTYGDLTRLF